jgi:hypothetical protein
MWATKSVWEQKLHKQINNFLFVVKEIQMSGIESNDQTDDEIALSSYALAALQEFLQEQQQKVTETTPTEMVFDEDWQLSQFWVFLSFFINKRSQQWRIIHTNH